jgi:hypothetical protein
MVSVWQNYLQSHLVGDPWSWVSLVLLLAAYPARLFHRNIELPSALIIISWVLMLLYCVNGVFQSFETTSSENQLWLHLNTMDYYSKTLIPATMKQMVLTLPFLLLQRLQLPPSETRLLLLFVGLAGLDVALLSTFPQHIWLNTT